LKKIIFILLIFLIGFAKAEDKAEELEVKLIETVATVITEKKNPAVYCIGYDEYKLSKYSDKLIITNNINKANIVIIGNDKNISKNIKKLAISLDLETFKDCDTCVAVLYWRKGRPQLIFSLERVNRFNINLPQEFKPYIKTEKELRI